MSLFPRFSEVSPLFRLIDEYDRSAQQAFSQVRAFQPKFDIKEKEDAYELHGELPGIEQNAINVEWTDNNTITISGRTERTHEEGQPPAENGKDYHKATVEEAPEEEPKTKAVAKQGSKEVGPPSADKFWVRERSVGEFYRSFSFPTRVDQDHIKCSLENGILSLVVPKMKAPATRKINIE